MSIVWKFGGTSVEKPETIQQVVRLFERAEERPRAIVFSAFAGVTNTLLELMNFAQSRDPGWQSLFDALERRHKEALQQLASDDSVTRGDVDRELGSLRDCLTGISLTGDISPKVSDIVLSFGERLSNQIISAAFRANGFEAEYLDARKILVSDRKFGEAHVLKNASYQKIREHFAADLPLQCVTGFIAASEDGETTTLGRGGSDLSASLIAAGLEATRLEIWSDVDGVLTVDPRIVPNSKLVSHLTYQEAMELSHFGAKVLYAPTLQPVREKGIPLQVRNTFRSDCSGTLISNETSTGKGIASGLSAIDQVVLITIQGSGMVGIPGVSHRLFGALATSQISVILITQASSEHSICLAIRPGEQAKAIDSIKQEFELEISVGRVDPPLLEEDCSIVSLVGENMQHTPGVAARVFDSLAKARVNVVAIAQGSSERNISLVVKAGDRISALRAIHSAFFEETPPSRCFVLGVGQVGSNLLSLIPQQESILRERFGRTLVVAGVANSSKYLLNEHTSHLSSHFSEKLASEGTPYTEISELGEVVLRSLGHGDVLVDCTASSSLTELYRTCFSNGISIVSANKTIQTQDWETYSELSQLARSGGCSWLYETSCGAALPVLSTLNNLVLVGDTVERIEAIFSGSMNYFFPNLPKLSQPKRSTKKQKRRDIWNQTPATTSSAQIFLENL